LAPQASDDLSNAGYLMTLQTLALLCYIGGSLLFLLGSVLLLWERLSR
jgi:hypothetical protein